MVGCNRLGFDNLGTQETGVIGEGKRTKGGLELCIYTREVSTPPPDDDDDDGGTTHSIVQYVNQFLPTQPILPLETDRYP